MNGRHYLFRMTPKKLFMLCILHLKTDTFKTRPYAKAAMLLARNINKKTTTLTDDTFLVVVV